MTDTKELIITPIAQTVVVGYKAEPVYTFDELPEDVQQRLIDSYDRGALERDFFESDADFYIDELKKMTWQKYKRRTNHDL